MSKVPDSIKGTGFYTPMDLVPDEYGPSTTPEPDSELEKILISYKFDYMNGTKRGHSGLTLAEALTALKACDERLKLEAKIDELKQVIRGYHSINHLMDEAELLNRISQLEAEKEGSK